MLCAMSENYMMQGDFSTPAPLLQEASDLLETTNNKWLQMLVLYFRGLLACYQGNSEEAAVLLEKAIEMAKGMKIDGKTIEEIMRYTKLSKEQIEKL